MYLAKRKILTIFLAFTYICSALFVHIGHVHSISDGLSPVHQIQSHDCGNNERHKPIGSEQHCELCQRILQFVSILDPVLFATPIQERLLIFPPLDFFNSQEVNLYSFNRGPPTLI